jgi:2-polyprenyl-3-methyl-5-hydroxy-6-metoxy-1,4-benzoquinol methylase
MSENQPGHEQRVQAARELWDSAADSFDNEPDHGLRDAVVRAAWQELLRASLPPSPAAVLDMGCGTGSLSVILAYLGYDVIGADVSPAMIAQAEVKASAAGYTIPFQVMDAAFPTLEPGQFDVVVCRHVLWSLPDMAQVLQRWTALLKPEGRLILIEGFWHTGAGVHAQDIVAAMPPSLTQVSVQNLSDRNEFWGSAVTDERYIIVAQR